MVLPRSDEGGSSTAGMMGQGSVVIFHCGQNTDKRLGVVGGEGRGWEAGGDDSEPGTISEGTEGSGKRQT